jgi:hypothetical protein
LANSSSKKIRSGSALSVVSAYFTIYAFEKLKGQLTTIEGMRFLFGEPRFVRSRDPDKADKQPFQIQDESLALGNRLKQKRLAKECADWITAKVEDAMLGRSNLTVSELENGNSHQIKNQPWEMLT